MPFSVNCQFGTNRTISPGYGGFFIAIFYISSSMIVYEVNILKVAMYNSHDYMLTAGVCFPVPVCSSGAVL